MKFEPKEITEKVTMTDCLNELEREISIRNKTLPKKVAKGLIDQEELDKRTNVINTIYNLVLITKINAEKAHSK